MGCELIRLPTDEKSLATIAQNLECAMKILDVADRLGAGEAFPPAGGQLESDAKDYYIIANLVAAGRISEARSHFWSLDTAARDPMPNDVYELHFTCE